ncbi:MAG: hypothetical protein J6Z36_03775, partial [Clostridia bacterium]|nr:hypothetical protein [Clostridia bacterium]
QIVVDELLERLQNDNFTIDSSYYDEESYLTEEYFEKKELLNRLNCLKKNYHQEETPKKQNFFSKFFNKIFKK